MGALTSVIAGVATIGGVIALTRLARRKAEEIAARSGARDGRNSDPDHGRTLDYERDPADGVYRAKP